MGRISQDKPYVSFQNGIITEASGLTYPEASLQDGDNINIAFDGSVRRRFGIGREVGASVTQYQKTEGIDSVKQAYSEHIWSSVGGDPTKYLLVLQAGNKLLLKALPDDGPITDSVKLNGASVELDITPFTKIPNDLGRSDPFFVPSTEIAGQYRLQSTNGGGHLWLTSPAHFPFLIKYDRATDNFTMLRVGVDPDTGVRRFFMRDLNGIKESTAVDFNPSALTAEHLYNLRNQGWPDQQINDYYNSYAPGTKFYPSNAQQWILGKNTSDNFDAAILKKQDFGTSPAPRGRLTIDPLVGQRDNFVAHTFGSILTNPLNFNRAKDEPSTAGFTTACFFSGRLVLAGDRNPKRPATVFISKIITSLSDAGVFGQENDPTSEHLNELLPNDGVVVPIPDADNIHKCLPYLGGIVVFANNGVWFINSSDQGVFSATDYSVNKIASTGSLGPDTVLEVDSGITFWAENSIHAITVGEGTPYPILVDIAETKIFRLYNAIPLTSRKTAKGVYDKVAKKCFWLHTTDSGGAFQTFTNALIYDIRTQAFTTYSFYNFATDLVEFGVVGALDGRRQVSPRYSEPVFVAGDPVTVGSNVVTAGVGLEFSANDSNQNNIKLLVISNEHSVTGSFMYVCEFNRLDFRDFGDIPNPTGLGVDYTSFFWPHPETLGDLQRSKSALYVHTFFQRTERKYYQVGTNTTYDRQSGCTIEGTWEWQSHSSPRTSRPQQAYRTRVAPKLENGQVLSNETIAISRIKVRGQGRSFAPRYTSQPGKDFVCLGYSVAFLVDADQKDGRV